MRAADTGTENGGSVHGFKDENVRKTLILLKKSTDYRMLHIEISYVNMCGALCGGVPHFCHIFGGFCLNY